MESHTCTSHISVGSISPILLTIPEFCALAKCGRTRAYQILNSGAIANTKSDLANSFGLILAAIRETSPLILEDHSAELYQAYYSGELSQLSSAVQSLVQQLLPEAISSSDGKDLFEYMQTNMRQVEYLSTTEDWKSCSNYLNGRAEKSLNVMSHSDLVSEYASLERLIRSSGNKGWKHQSIPNWAEEKGAFLVRQAGIIVAKAGLDPDKIETDDRTSCLFTYTLLRLISEQGEIDASIITRWLYSQR